MKKYALALSTCLVILCHAQENTRITGNMYVANNGSLAIFGNLEVASGGLLENAGLLITKGELTGDENIKLDATASLDIENGTLSLTNETDEEFANVTMRDGGIVEVPAGGSLTITGNFNNINSTGNGIILRADNTGYAQLLTTGTVAAKGLMQAEQWLTSTTTGGWRQLSSPVATTLADFDDDLDLYYPATPGSNPKQYNVFWYDASPVGGAGQVTPPAVGASSNAKHLTEATANTELLDASRAYTIFTRGSNGVFDGGRIDVVGALGNGDYTTNLYRTNDISPTLTGPPASVDPNLITGWNLIANPYPSNIDIQVLVADPDFDPAYKAVHVWDATNQQYAALTDDLSSAIDWSTNAALGAASNVAPFQAFWVKADAVPSSGASVEAVTLKNTHRTLTSNLNVFKQTPPVIAIRTWDVASATRDQALLAFDMSYDNNLDGLDALKLKSTNPDVPTLCTKVEGISVNINRLAVPEPSHSIPLSFESRFNGAVFFIGMATQDINPDWSIYLEDRKLNTMFNLRKGDYNFVHDPSFSETRFTVHINKTGGQTDVFGQDYTRIYTDDDGISIAFYNPEATQADVLITNLAGQILYTGTVSTGALFTYPVNAPPAMYIVYITLPNKTTFDKVVR